MQAIGLGGIMATSSLYWFSRCKNIYTECITETNPCCAVYIFPIMDEFLAIVMNST